MTELMAAELSAGLLALLLAGAITAVGVALARCPDGELDAPDEHGPEPEDRPGLDISQWDDEITPTIRVRAEREGLL